MQYKLSQLLTPYNERNSSGVFPPVAVGRYGIRKREDIYKKALSADYSKNKVIRKNSLIIGMGSVQIDIGVLSDDFVYSVSPAYHTFRINSEIVISKYLELVFKANNDLFTKKFMIASARQGKKVNIRELMLEKVNIPSFYIQEKTLQSISSVEKCIKAYNKIIELCDELIKSRFINLGVLNVSKKSF